MTQVVHPGSFPRARYCCLPRAGLWLRDRSGFIGLCQVRVLSPHDGHRLLLQERDFVLSDLPDNRPVNAEVLMHREVTEGPDLPPGHVRIPVSQGVRKSAGDLSQQEQPVQNGVPPQPVLVPLPAAYAVQILPNGLCIVYKEAYSRS